MFARVAFRPDMLFRLYVYQLHRNADLIVRSLHGSLDEIVRAKFNADALPSLDRIAIGLGRGATDYRHPSDFR